jgi:hypothetical protein
MAKHLFSVALLAIALAGCSGSSKSGWAGTWTCTYSLVDVIDSTGGSNTFDHDGTEDLSIAQASNGDITLTPIDDSGGACGIVATTSGDTATFKADQTCDSYTYGGTLTLNGDTLTIMETESLALDSTDQNSTEQATCKRN